MTTELKLTSRTGSDPLGRPRMFHYYLTIDLVEGPAIALENYGVCIREEGGDTACVPGITTSATRIDELITLLVDNLVSPASLRDVIDDWL